jgi:hypothetical protein
MRAPILLSSWLGFLVFTTAASADLNVLVIGDSHSAGSFGEGLVNALAKDQRVRVSLKASCGSSTQNWLEPSDSAYGKFTNRICVGTMNPGDKTMHYEAAVRASRTVPSLVELKREKKADAVVVALGTNQFPHGSTISEKSLKNGIEHLVRDAQAGGSRCVWIGPPNEPDSIFPVAGQKAFVSFLQKTVEAKGCTFVNSQLNGLTDPSDTVNDPSRIHYFPYTKKRPAPKGHDQDPGGAWGIKAASQVHTALFPVGGHVVEQTTTGTNGN